MSTTALSSDRQAGISSISRTASALCASPSSSCLAAMGWCCLEYLDPSDPIECLQSDHNHIEYSAESTSSALVPNDRELTVCDLQEPSSSCGNVISSPCVPMSSRTSHECTMCPLACDIFLVLKCNYEFSLSLHCSVLSPLEQCLSSSVSFLSCLVVCGWSRMVHGSIKKQLFEIPLLSCFLFFNG